MPPVPDRSTFTSAYASKAPWDIGRPQQAVVEAAEQFTGVVLDVGCGTGENALFLARRGLEVTGIDFLARPIERAKEKAQGFNLPVQFLVRDALTLGEWPRRFDSVLDCGLFHVFTDEDREKYVQGLGTVLKPGGRLFLLCFSDAEPGVQGPRRVSREELKWAFRQGWAMESIKAHRFEVAPDLPELNFSPGGPHAWFAVARRL